MKNQNQLRKVWTRKVYIAAVEDVQTGQSKYGSWTKSKIKTDEAVYISFDGRFFRQYIGRQCLASLWERVITPQDGKPYLQQTLKFEDEKDQKMAILKQILAKQDEILIALGNLKAHTIIKERHDTLPVLCEEEIPNNIPEEMPEDIPEDIPEDMPEDIPEDILEEMYGN